MRWHHRYAVWDFCLVAHSDLYKQSRSLFSGLLRFLFSAGRCFIILYGSRNLLFLWTYCGFFVYNYIFFPELFVFWFLLWSFESFRCQTVCILWFFAKNFISATVTLDSSYFFIVQVLLLQRRERIVKVLNILDLVCFWTMGGSRI
jgi:hypothetical protein